MWVWFIITSVWIGVEVFVVTCATKNCMPRLATILIQRSGVYAQMGWGVHFRFMIEFPTNFGKTLGHPGRRISFKFCMDHRFSLSFEIIFSSCACRSLLNNRLTKNSAAPFWEPHFTSRLVRLLTLYRHTSFHTNLPLAGVFAITVFVVHNLYDNLHIFWKGISIEEAYSVIKPGNEIKCWPKSPSKWLAARTSLCIFDQAASFERGFCNIFKCTRILFFVAMLSQSPSLPFDSVQACLHGRECVHFGQQANMWFYTYSSMLCP